MMTRRHILHLALIAVLACAGSVYAQIPSVDRSAIASAAVPSSISAGPEKNPAPHMRVQVLSRNSEEITYAIIFGKGDEVMAGLTEFAEKEHLGASRITGIGGIEDATVGYFDRQHMMHQPIRIHQQCEVLSLLGDIALFHGKPAVHLHMVVGFPDGSAHGGHLLKAYVWPTMEVIVTDYPNTMHKKLDAETGAALIDPSEKE